MNGAMHHLTPTQLASYERSKAFKAKIAAQAAKLNSANSPEALLRALPPESCAAKTAAPPAEIIPLPPTKPREQFWFHIEEHHGCPSIARIKEAVCDQFGVSQHDLLSSSHEWRITLPRQVAMYLCRDMTPTSLTEIGRRFGKKDHSTPFHAYHKISKRIERDAAFAAEIAKLKERLA